MKITSLKQKKEKQINLFVLQMNDNVTQKGGKEYSQVTCHSSVRAAYLQSEAKSKISKLIPAWEQRVHPSILEETQAAWSTGLHPLTMWCHLGKPSKGKACRPMWIQATRGSGDTERGCACNRSSTGFCYFFKLRTSACWHKHQRSITLWFKH